MTRKTLLAIDQGTTSSRVILFSDTGKILDCAQKEVTLFYPQPGWVEQDADALVADVIALCRTVLSRNEQHQHCAGIGITNQRETTILWDRTTGKAAAPAIVWQDRRTADICKKMSDAGYDKMMAEKTGLRFDPYFSCSKIHFLLQQNPALRTKAEKGEILFGTVDSFLLWHLTGGKTHATDATNASRTGLYNIVTKEWDDELLALWDIPHVLLPDVKDNIGLFGTTDATLVGTALPIGGMAGDQQAALIGQGCIDLGQIKATYGTGCFALMPIGDNFRVSQHRLLTTIAYQVAGKTVYALEGSIFTAGAIIQWLRDELHVITRADESETLAVSVADNGGVFFVPAFTGLGAPYWNPDARAAITGLTRGTTKAHIVRAALEAQGFQTHDLLAAMQEDAGHPIQKLRIDGGLAANTFMAQFLADITALPVERPRVLETTAWGAAVLAGIQAGIFADLTHAAHNWAADRAFQPVMDDATRQALLAGWKKAINSVLL